MRKTFFTFIIPVACLLVCSCQTKKALTQIPITYHEVNYIPYYLKVYEADSLFLTNNYKRSYEILDSLFKKYEPLNMENYYEYGSYLASAVMSGHVEDIDVKIKKGYLNFGDIKSSHSHGYELYTAVKKASHLTKVDVDSLKKEYSKKINLDLRKRIDRMFDEDQSVRLNNLDQEKMKFFIEKHSKELEEIMDLYGYPNYQLIGSMNYEDENWISTKPLSADILFVHQDVAFQEKYLPVLFKKLKEGKCSPGDYGWIFDKTIWVKTSGENNTHKQLYGTFPGIPLVSPKKIDSIRASIGLPRLGYEVWRFKAVFQE